MDEYEVYRRGQTVGGPLHSGTADDLALGLLPRCGREALLAVALEALRLYVGSARVGDAERLRRARAYGIRLADLGPDLEAEAVLQGMGTEDVRDHLRGAD